MQSIPDAVIVRQLKSISAREVDKVLAYLHQRSFPTVRKFIQKNSGTFSDAEDIFQDGLLALYKLARQEKIDESIQVEAYLFSICRNLWFKKINKRQDTVDLQKVEEFIQEQEMHVDQLLAAEKSEVVDGLMMELGEKCRTILIYYYYDRIRMKKIAELMGFSNEQVAKNKKSNCIKKMSAIIVAHPFYKNYFE